jgi:hypothetical protein
MRIEYHPTAWREMLDAAEYYDSVLSGLGDEFLSDLQRVEDRIKRNPRIGARYAGPFLSTLLNRFPYAVFYRIATDGILVLAITHQRRKPGYWIERK